MNTLSPLGVRSGVAALLLLLGCSHEESAAVVQARAAVTLAWSDARAAHVAQAAAEAELNRTHAAVAAADREPMLVQARSVYASASRRQQALWDDRHRWEADSRLDSTGHFVRTAPLAELDDQLVAHGGDVVRAQNVVVRLQQPLRAAQAADQTAANRVARARGDAIAKDAVLARARQMLQATIAAAEQ